jgi:hypothetical protein
VNINPGISATTPFNEYVAFRVIVSLSSSLKFVDRSIYFTSLGRAGTDAGIEINRGLAFVIVKVKLAETVKRESDTITDIV